MTRTFGSLPEIARFLREQLKDKRYVLLYAHNGTGKTRLSVEFKNLGKSGDARDTLYFNAFTEDLFYWDNDLEGDERRTLKFNINSRFFNGLKDLEMDNRIKEFLDPYCTFDFRILDDHVMFSRRDLASAGQEATEAHQTHIKISRAKSSSSSGAFFSPSCV